MFDPLNTRYYELFDEVLNDGNKELYMPLKTTVLYKQIYPEYYTLTTIKTRQNEYNI